jgi:hypothetical protein
MIISRVNTNEGKIPVLVTASPRPPSRYTREIKGANGVFYSLSISFSVDIEII